VIPWSPEIVDVMRDPAAFSSYPGDLRFSSQIRLEAKRTVSHPVRAASSGPPGRDGRRAAGLRGTNGASPLPMHLTS
jgi:hypothetical protein